MIPIAITSMSACSALGVSLDETVAALHRHAVGIRLPVDLEQSTSSGAGAGEVPLPEHFRGPFRAERMLRGIIHDVLDPSDRRSIETTGDRWGVVLGTTLAGMRHCGVGMRADERGSFVEADSALARTCASSVLAHALGDLGIAGPTTTVSCACASALTAISHACALLESRAVDAVVAGGYDPIAEFAYGGFSALQLVAKGPLSPFASDREGMKLGEGAVAFVLRRLDDCADRLVEQRVRAVIVAAAESSDAHHLTQPHPEGRGATRALRGVSDRTVLPHVLIAHATGTEGNDASEYRAYRATFGERLPDVPVVALKSRFGHPLGAAGALELAAVIGCSERGFTPTTAGRGRDREGFPELQLLEGDCRASAPNDVIVLSSGFGGANAAMRVTRQRPTEPPSARPAADAATLRIRAVGAVSPGGRGIAGLEQLAAPGADFLEFDESMLASLVDPIRSRRLSLLAKLMIGAVRDLLDSHPLDPAALRETPLIAANWCGAAQFTERYYRDLVRSGVDLANPMLFAESVPNIGSAQCSLAFGIEAPTLSVIGRRTASLEALALVAARFATGDWNRAIVVAAEEAHPIVARVLARCGGREVDLRSGAVAMLLENGASASSVWGAVHRVFGRTAPLAVENAARRALSEVCGASAICTSGSVFDGAIREALVDKDSSPIACVRLPEMGAATPLAALLASAPRASEQRAVAASDPHGACWILTHSTC